MLFFNIKVENIFNLTHSLHYCPSDQIEDLEMGSYAGGSLVSQGLPREEHRRGQIDISEIFTVKGKMSMAKHTSGFDDGEKKFAPNFWKLE